MTEMTVGDGVGQLSHRLNQLIQQLVQCLARREGAFQIRQGFNVDQMQGTGRLDNQPLLLITIR